MLAAAIGCTLGIVPHLLASVLGLTYILHMSALIFQGLKWLGVGYLLYLAWSMWRDSGQLGLDSAEKPTRSSQQIIQKGIWLNLLNPKLTLFFFTFLPLFLSPTTASPTIQLLSMSGLFMGMTLLIFVLYGLLATTVRTHLLQSPTITVWLRRSFAAAFVLLGLRLAVSKQN